MIVSGGEVLRFVEERTGAQLIPPCVAIGRAVNGRIVAGVAFSCFTGADIEMTVAADRGGLSRMLLRECGRYVFGKAGCERVSLTTESQMVASVARRLGARDEGVKRNAFGKGRDGMMLGIIKEEWTL